MSETRRGALYGATAYLLWGVFPLYFPLLDPAGPVEVLAHRIVWSLAVMVVIVAATRKGAAVRAVLADRRKLLTLSAAATVLAVNWGVYIYGVTSDRVVETSLGYFINPLVSVMLGVVVLRERLRRAQWAALGIALVAVLVLSIENGRPPWLALILAFSFGTYGLLKKTARVGAVEGLAVETGVLAPLAVAYLLFLGLRGDATFLSSGPDHAVLLALTGLITAVPLLFFGAAAVRVPLATLGVLQYLAPTMQFLLGVLVFDEALGLAKLLGFVLVWVALCAFTLDLVRSSRRNRMPVAEPV
ncbi:MAG: EamA family transporter RarD [Actinobacteria bacterium]|nr:EamA family transporter RarD [Actinomycetota bacterium]MCA1721384.1 EamA family transporter RarD [Actinomycetota bacterium]